MTNLTSRTDRKDCLTGLGKLNVGFYAFDFLTLCYNANALNAFDMYAFLRAGNYIKDDI